MNRRYQGIEVVKSDSGKSLYTTNYYPHVPPTNNDLYLITTQQDRYDLLAHSYYGDKTLWWVIPTANNLPCDTLFPEPGIQLRIPVDVTGVLRQYNRLNSE